MCYCVCIWREGHQGFIRDFELVGWGEHGGSRMIVVCESSGGLGACSPRKILNLDPLRVLLTQSGT